MAPVSEPGLTVVVPTRDRPQHLATCLQALTRVLRPIDQLLVVDSASQRAETAEVARAHGATVVRCELPGASRARNAGIRRAERTIVAFIDDDVRVHTGWPEALDRAFADPSIGFVTGRVTVPQDQRDHQRTVAIKDDAVGHRLDRHTRAPLGASANLAVRRRALEAVGGFDEAMGGGARFQAAEDLDLFDRLLAMGEIGRYEPAASAEHDQWRPRMTLLRLDARYGFGAGARLAKLARTDRRRALKAGREAFWADGLRPLGVALRNRHEFEIASALMRLAGTAAGLLPGCLHPLADGRFR